MGKRKAMTPSRLRVLEAFREDPLASVRELAQILGMSASNVSSHLSNLQSDGLIVRPKLVRTWKTATPPKYDSQRNFGLTERILPRGRGNLSNSAKRSEDGRKGKGADAFTPKEAKWWTQAQARIEQVVQEAEAKGKSTMKGFEYIRIDEPVGGCKCG